jgi:hypothetical protein
MRLEGLGKLKKLNYLQGQSVFHLNNVNIVGFYYLFNYATCFRSYGHLQVFLLLNFECNVVFSAQPLHRIITLVTNL